MTIGPTPPADRPLRFHNGARTDWWFDPVKSRVYSTHNESAQEKSDLGSFAEKLDALRADGALQETHFEKITYLHNGNGVYGGGHLWAHDTNGNKKFDAGDTAELVLSGWVDERDSKGYYTYLGERQLSYLWNEDAHRFEDSSKYFSYKWQSDGKGGGTFVRIARPVHASH